MGLSRPPGRLLAEESVGRPMGGPCLIALTPGGRQIEVRSGTLCRLLDHSSGGYPGTHRREYLSLAPPEAGSSADRPEGSTSPSVANP